MQKQILEIDTGTGPSARMVELAETLVKKKKIGQCLAVLFFILILKTKTKCQKLNAKHCRIYKMFR